ncbi:MAG: NAD-dependent epimerase/dehydratase family protein [Hyphomicrobiales bacterium]
MKIFVLGASGYIGSAVIEELRAHGHNVIAQTTRKKAAEQLEADGFEVVVGKMEKPEKWLKAAIKADAIVQIANTFDDDAGAVESAMFRALQNALEEKNRKIRLIYTGGCWLFGKTGDETAAEGDEYNPLKGDEYSVRRCKKLKKSDVFETIIVHPAMVWDREGGVLKSMLESARTGKPVRVVNGPEVRWPMVHREDVATLYRLALEKGKPGRDYHGAAGNAVTVGELATAVGRRVAYAPTFEVVSEDEIAAELGEWARGYGLDQQMTAKRTMFELGWRPKYVNVLDHLGPYGPR